MERGGAGGRGGVEKKGGPLRSQSRPAAEGNSDSTGGPTERPSSATRAREEWGNPGWGRVR